MLNKNDGQILQGIDIDALTLGNQHNGVVNDFTASLSGGLVIKVNTGSAIINTIMTINASVQYVTLSGADVNPRYDLIELSGTNATAISIKGTPTAGSPNVPDVNTSRIPIAAIFVGSNVSAITAGNIVDKRVIVPDGSVNLSGLSDTSQARGDVIIGESGTSIYKKLAIGTNFQVLTADSNSADNIKWDTGGLKYLDGDFSAGSLVGSTTTRLLASGTIPANSVNEGANISWDIHIDDGNNNAVRRPYTILAGSFGSEVAIGSVTAYTGSAVDEMGLIDMPLHLQTRITDMDWTGSVSVTCEVSGLASASTIVFNKGLIITGR